MAVDTHCHSEAELRSWSLGQLDEYVSEQIAEHLSLCAVCEETVASFDNTSDSLINDLRNPQSGDGLSSDSEIQESQRHETLRRIPNPWLSAACGPAAGNPREFLRDYELLEQIGTGGMGSVYRAMHVRLQRVVAVKLLPARRLRDQAAVNRFEREMQAIGLLDHPSIVRATDAGEVDGTHFLAMDFVDGIDLSRMVRFGGPFSVSDACEVIRQAALGLQYAHDQGLVHRDVKPSNLMLDSRSAGESSHEGPSEAISVRILDLGLALFGSASESVDELTTVGQLMGTLDYMAPEQADNSHSVDARADIYSLGATLFKLLTGSAPYETRALRSPLRKMKALATTDPPPIADRKRDLPEGLGSIVDRMLHRNPTDRYLTAREVADALRPYCEGHTLRTSALRCIAEGDRRSREETSAFQLSETPPAPRANERHSEGAVSLNRRHPQAGRSGNRRSLVRWALILAALPLFLFAGLTIWLKTGEGRLKIETHVDGVSLEIRQGNKVVDAFDVSTEGKHVTLRSGAYEVVIPEPHDGLLINEGTFTLTRGREHLVTITRMPLSDADSMEMSEADTQAEFTHPGNQERAAGSPVISLQPEMVPEFEDPVARLEFLHLSQSFLRLQRQRQSIESELNQIRQKYGKTHPQLVAASNRLEYTRRELAETQAQLEELVEQSRLESAKRDQQFREAASGPTYEGNGFHYWNRILENERSPAELERAVMALCILSRGVRESEAATSVMSVIRHFPCAIGRDSPESKLVTTAIRYLRSLDPAAVEVAITAELHRNDGNGKAHIFDALLNSSVSGSAFTRRSVEVGSPQELIQHLTRSKLFISTILEEFHQLSPDHQRVASALLPEAGVIPEIDQSLQQLLDQLLLSEMEDLQLFAAGRLIDIAPRREIADPIVRHLHATAARSADLDGRQIRMWQQLWTLREYLEPDVEKLLTLPRGKRSQRAFSGALRGSRSGNGRSRPQVFSTYEDENAVPIRIAGSAANDVAEIEYLAISRRLLQIELLAGIGVRTEAVVALLDESIYRLAGQQPAADGDWEYASPRRSFLIEAPLQLESGGPRVWQGPNAPLSQPGINTGDVELMNSLLLAYEKIAGHPARFRNRLQFSDGRSAQWNPQLTAYQQLSLDDWLAVDVAAMKTRDELMAISTGIQSLAHDSARQARSSGMMQLVLSSMIRQTVAKLPATGHGSSDLRGYLAGSDGGALNEALAWCFHTDAEATLNTVVDLFDDATPDIQAFILEAIAAPASTPPGLNQLRPVFSQFALRLRSDEHSSQRFKNIEKNWPRLPDHLKHSVLRLELAAPTISESPSINLLTKILQDLDSPFATDAGFALAMKADTPAELIPLVIDVLIREIEDPRDDASLVNSVVCVSRIWNDELLPKAAERLLKVLRSDMARDKPYAFRIHCRLPDERDEFALTLSRRILVAELLRAGSGTDQNLRSDLVSVLSESVSIDQELAAVSIEYRTLDLLLKIAGRVSADDIHTDGSFSQAALFTSGKEAPAAAERDAFQFSAQDIVTQLRDKNP